MIMKNKQLFYILTIFISIMFLCTADLFSYTIYKWTDQNGVTHYTDKLPEESKEQIEIIKTKKREKSPVKETVVEEEIVVEDPALAEGELLQEEIRQYWRNLALNIEQKKERILEEIYITERKIDILKSNIDYYLIYGYKADFMILDLRFLESSLPPLFAQLEAVEKELCRLGFTVSSEQFSTLSWGIHAQLH